ncbi:MAG TPA: BMP family protein [Gemmatimonadaceae bacterium]|nr:BMP family protein [Gemmatimonadaceae bacterium]
MSTVVHTTLYLLLAAATAACGTRSRDATARDSGTATARDGKPFRVALLTPGPISDQSWNGGAYKGLERIRDSLGASISHIQTKTPAEFDENFRQYGAQGYDLVFGHGFEFQDAAARVAPEYPKTVYITTSGNRTGANVAGIEFAFEDASYQAGILAGAMSKSGVVGVIGGTELPPVKTSFRAFEAGARSVNPRVRVLTSYVGNWDDVSAAKEQALAQIGQSADVIFQNADQAGLGVFQAAKEHRGVYVIGSNSDQNAVAPEVTLGSVVIDLPHAFLSVAREVKSGTFKPRVIELGSASDVVKLVLNPALASSIPAATRSAIDSVGALLKAGKMTAIPK